MVNILAYADDLVLLAPSTFCSYFYTFCLYFYHIGLWCNFTPGAFAKLQSAYVKCVKYFSYSKFYSVTMMLNELALPRFEEITGKYRCELRQQMSCSNDGLVSPFLHVSVCVVIVV